MVSLLEDTLAAHDSYQEDRFGEEYLEATGGSLVEGGPSDSSDHGMFSCGQVSLANLQIVCVERL
jgi:hypothetical protein